jgi:tyrosyl-tRNA synthetase
MCDTSLKQTENGSTIYFNEPAITAWSTIVNAFLRKIEQATSSQAISELRASLTVDLPQHISSFVDGRFQQLLNQEKAIEDAQRAAQLAAQNPSQGLTELDIAIQQAAVNGVDPNIIEGLRNQRSQLRRNTTKNSTVNAFNNLSDKKKILLIISSIILVVLISSLLFRPSKPKVIYKSSDYTM